MNLKLVVLAGSCGDTIALIDMDSDYVKHATNVTLLSDDSVQYLLQKRVWSNIEAFLRIVSDDDFYKLL